MFIINKLLFLSLLLFITTSLFIQKQTKRRITEALTQ